MVSLGLCCYEKTLSSCSVRGLLFLAAHQHLILVAFLAIQPVMVSLLEESLASINTWFFFLFFFVTHIKLSSFLLSIWWFFALLQILLPGNRLTLCSFPLALIWRGWFFFFFVKFLYSMFYNKATFFFFPLMGPHRFFSWTSMLFCYNWFESQ